MSRSTASGYSFYINTTSQVSFTKHDFIDVGQSSVNFRSGGVMISHDSTSGTLTVSFDGTNAHFALNQGETVTFTNRQEFSTWIKGSSVGQAYRLAAWGTFE